MCSLPSLPIFPFFLPIDGIQAFPDIINAVCLNDVYNLFNWDHGKLKWKFCTAPFTQSTEWWHFTELHWQLKMCERSEDLDARLSDQSWGHVSEKWPSDYSTKGCVQMLCPNTMSLCPDIEEEQMLEKPESKLLLKTFSCERINLCISH